MKSLARNILFQIFYIFRVHSIVRRKQKNALTILLYHGVAPRVESGIYNYRGKNISPENFDKHILYLKKHYTILDLDEAIEKLQKNEELPPYPLVITFDDGYQNASKYVYPILKKHDVTATIFVVTNFVDKKIPLWVDRLEYTIGHGTKYSHLQKEEKIKIDDAIRTKLKKMETSACAQYLQTLEAENGAHLSTFEGDQSYYAPLCWDDIVETNGEHLRYGAHTENHPILTKIPISEARTEIGASMRALERYVSNPSKVFAYPNGQREDFNEDIKRTVSELGFTSALTTLPGLNSSDTDRFAMNRYTMDGTESMISFTMRVTGTFSWFKQLLRR